MPTIKINIEIIMLSNYYNNKNNNNNNNTKNNKLGQYVYLKKPCLLNEATRIIQSFQA